MRDLTRQTPIAILALNVDTQENEQVLLDTLGFKYFSLEGYYNRKKENSYAVFLTTAFTLGAVTDLARGFNQESILVSNEWRESHLLFLKDNTKQHLGVLKEVHEKEAKAKDCYTYNPEVDRYYVCK